ncbi:MAG TPA: tetratricopeptide repeat protein [Pyrinomonadaceae bacterium]|jgi:predicted ATPase/DNA-binding winged helix-turn-helix (wHTH) protein/Tfp pilus assembly protein PilF
MKETTQKQRLIYRFAEFEINVGEGLLRRGGEIVPLTPKIFEMLVLLVENNNRMLTKDEIMRAVWADSFVEETNLTSNISRLRKILHAGGAKFIETFPKRGYRFSGHIEAVAPETEIILTRRIRTEVRQIVEETDEAEIAPEYIAYLAAVPNNLSCPLTPIVGRGKEIAGIEELLRKNRLITLTGVGGTGKTRLAQEIALRMLSEFTGGVFFFALETIKSAELVAPTIAQILGVKESGGKSLPETLKDFLREKQILLVADNFEQIVSAAPFLAGLLDAAPRLKILATSRTPLNLKAEREFRVPSLELPAGEISENSFAELLETEAVKLFADRAKIIKPNFTFNRQNAATIAGICLRLEGLPLAIELAAARIKILSPEQILARLENRLKLLTGGAKDLPARQQTMRGAIEWSFDLLNENERILFRRLAVFAGGFRVEAVESICPSAEIDLLNCLTSLVENNLVVQTETTDGESRFRLLEVIREYALEILEASGESEMIRKNHARYFLALATAAEPEFFGENAAKWLDRLEEEHDNLRAALSRAASARDDETIMNLTAALRTFWLLHNHLTEGRKWLETALELSFDTSANLRSKLLHGLGQAALYQGDNRTAREKFAEGLKLGEAGGDKRQIALSNRGLAAAAKQQGDIAGARKFIEEALAINRASNDIFGVAVSLNNLGDLARMEDDYVAARRLLEEALEICRQLGNKEGVCGCLNNLGAVTYGEGDYEAAQAHYAEALKTSRDLGDKITISYSLNGFAALAFKRGDIERAIKLTGAAEHLRESLGFEIEPAERRFCERYLAELKAESDETYFDNLREQGRKLKLEDSTDLCFNESRGKN